MIRTDIHRPSAIIPSDYEYVAQECAPILGLGIRSFILAERERIRAHMSRTGGKYSSHEHGGNCGVCGSVNAIYTILFYHAPTNTYVRMGQDCARKCEMSYDDEIARLFRKNVRDVREHMARKAKAAALLADAELDDAWALYINETTDRTKWEERTVCDIVGKLVQYGSISDKQEKFLHTLLDTIANRPALEAAQQAEKDAAQPAPVGRVKVTGQVLSIRFPARDEMGSPKMLVKTEAGWKLWVTIPRATFAAQDKERHTTGVNDSLKGKTVSLTATVTPSKDDPKFAWGKRPVFHGFITSEGVANV